MDKDCTALVLWLKAIDDTGFIPDTLDLWNPSLRREDPQWIQWTADLNPRLICSYYTDKSKQQSNTVSFAFLIVIEDQITMESQFCLTNGAKVFAAEVLAIKESIAADHRVSYR